MAMVHIFAAVATSATLTARSVTECQPPRAHPACAGLSRGLGGKPAALWLASAMGLGHDSDKITTPSKGPP